MYNVKVINDITFNQPCPITAHFKDFLVYDEVAEFMKRFYSRSSGHAKVKKLIHFYTSCFKVFPNYVCIKERVYMYKNIKRKQRHIDER